MKKIAVLFPGGGVQYAGMGKQLYHEFPAARAVLDEAEDLLRVNLKQYCFTGSLDELSRMDIAQPAIFTISVAAYRAFAAEFSITPIVSAGHSLGEFSALHCAGALTFEQALRLVRRRGELLRETGAGGYTMMAVNKLGGVLVNEACGRLCGQQKAVFVAAYNSPLQQVISGAAADMQELQRLLEQSGGEASFLNIPTPSHCALIQQAADQFRPALLQTAFGPLNWPVVANVTGEPYGDTGQAAGILYLHMTRPVQWEASMRFVSDLRPDLILDMGPQSVLKKLAAHNGLAVPAASFDVEEDRKYVRAVLGKKGDDSTAFLQKCLVAAASSRNYGDEEGRGYPDTVPAAYGRLQLLLAAARQATPAATCRQEALALVDNILTTKRTPEAERQQLLAELESGI